MRIRRLEVAGDEQGSNVLIKREVEWLAEDSRPPGLAFQELKLDKEFLPSIKTEEDPFHTDTEANAVHGFTPVPQTNEYLKTELILDEELIDNINYSEANCKQHVIDDPQLVGAGITVKKSETGELSSPCDFSKRLRNVEVHMVSNHLGASQSITPGVPTTDDDSIKSNPRSTFICEECGSSFTRKSNLKKHMLRKHCGKAEPRFECEICSRSCTTKEILKVHRRIHSKDRRREFACDLCGKSFYEKGKLSTHKKIHAGDLYDCKVCGQRFTLKQSLTRHVVRSEHFDKPQQFPPQSSDNEVAFLKTELMSDEEFIDEGNGSEPVSQLNGVDTAVDSVTCEVCHKSYPEKLIRAHMSLKHSDKAYNCQFCSQVYWKKSAFEKHISRHKNGKREFDCELCEKKFYSRNGLKYHMDTHTGKTVSCEVCGAHYLQTQGLKRHMLRVHRKNTVTPASQTANADSLQTKEELIEETSSV